MNDKQEFSYKQLRQLALTQGVDDNKISIGIWGKLNGYSKKCAYKKITRFLPFTSR